MSGANNVTSVGVGSADWQTPRDLFAQWNRRWLFNYDAAASHENALLPVYSTIDGTFGRHGPDHCPMPASRWFGKPLPDESTGLTYPWAKRRVFCNPPYSRGEIEKWVEKAASERNEAALIVMLLPDARDTRWWREYVKPFARDYPIGRVRFIDPRTGEPGTSPPGGHVLAQYLPDWLS